ncbi:MAG: hypothetical protein ABSF67_04970 [Roseiarcus sp.]
MPGYLCVSFAGSPELAKQAFAAFAVRYPGGANFSETVGFFESSSAETENQYLIAFGRNPRLITIREGRRVDRIAKTHWIGDRDAFERFREYETRRRERPEHRRAVNAALLADEMTGSPASDLYSAMKNVVVDKDMASVGGFVSLISNRDIGFRYSVYSDMLLDWPKELAEGRNFNLNDPFTLRSTGENDRFSVNQISPGYYDANITAFYVLKGRLLYIFYGLNNGLADRCVVVDKVEPQAIAATINAKLGFDLSPLLLVMSARNDFPAVATRTDPKSGVAMGLFCEANTMPKVPNTPQ